MTRDTPLNDGAGSEPTESADSVELSVELSVVVPVLDEEESLPHLHRELSETLRGTGRSHEIIFVDDYSTDRSREVMLALRAADPHVRVVCLRRNFGQTAAMAAGFDATRAARS